MIIGMVRYAIPNAFKNLNNSRDIKQLYEEPYFSDRFNIFCDITLQSFIHQTNKDFKLFIYHTNLIPSDKKVLFNNLELQYPFLKNVFIPDDNMYIPQEYIEDINLTFRIDNDDGIAINFIEKLQEVKKNYTENTVITIPTLYKLCRLSENEFKVAKIYYPSNSIGLAYLTNEQNKTIMNLGFHDQIIKKLKAIKLSGNGGLQIINNYNVLNDFNRKNDKKKNYNVYTFNLKDAQNFLIKNNYGNLDLTCIPILEER